MIFVHDTPTNRLLNMVLSGGSPVVEYTATGNPLTFLTDLARPLKSLLIPFTPVQSGTGDPSPSNIRPILPWNGLTVNHAGKNLFNLTAQTVEVSSVKWEVVGDTIYVSGTASGYSAFDCGMVDVRGLKKIRVSGLYETTTNIIWSCFLKDKDGNTVAPVGSWYTDFTIDLTSYPTATTLLVQIKRNNNVETSGIIKIQVEVGETTTAYEPYAPITETDISFASPVYGGTLDVVSGVLRVQWGAKKVKDIEWTYNAQNTRFVGTIEDIKLYPAVRTTPFYASVFVSVDDGRGISSVPNNAVYGGINSTTIYVKCEDYTDPEDFVTAYGEQVICYPLENPQEIQLTPAQITALVGNNTMWSDADGQMTAVYLKKG